MPTKHRARKSQKKRHAARRTTRSTTARRTKARRTASRGTTSKSNSVVQKLRKQLRTSNQRITEVKAENLRQLKTVKATAYKQAVAEIVKELHKHSAQRIKTIEQAVIKFEKHLAKQLNKKIGGKAKVRKTASKKHRKAKAKRTSIKKFPAKHGSIFSMISRSTHKRRGKSHRLAA